jgi:hypothetical protein
VLIERNDIMQESDKPFVLKDCDAERAEMLRQQISKVRCWIAGFVQAGKIGPPGEDGLRQIEIILKESITKHRERGS